MFIPDFYNLTILYPNRFKTKFYHNLYTDDDWKSQCLCMHIQGDSMSELGKDPL